MTASLDLKPSKQVTQSLETGDSKPSTCTEQTAARARTTRGAASNQTIRGEGANLNLSDRLLGLVNTRANANLMQEQKSM